MPLIGVPLIDECLMGVHLIDVYLKDVHLIGVCFIGGRLMGVYLVGVYLVGVYPQACISWACTSLRVPHWYVRYGHAPHWLASHRRVHRRRRRDHGVGRESSSHVCNTNCVRAQVHLAILSLALFVPMIRHNSGC